MRARQSPLRRAVPLGAAALSGLAACAPDAPPLPGLSASVPADEFRCPKPGTRATFGAGSRPVVYQGADPADPLVCLVTLPDGRQVRRVANWTVAPPGQERAMRDGMARLFPTAAGKEARYSYFQGYRNDPTSTGQYMEHWTTLGGQTLTVGGAPVRTVVFQRDTDEVQRYGSFGMRWLLWFAPESGVWVRGEPTLLRGEATLRPFSASGLQVP